MKVALSEIFIHNVHQQNFTKEALLGLDIKTEFVKRLAHHLGLGHLENESTESNLCYAFDTNINPDYKVILSKSDIKNYLKNTLKPIDYHIGSDTVEFPESLNP